MYRENKREEKDVIAERDERGRGSSAVRSSTVIFLMCSAKQTINSQHFRVIISSLNGSRCLRNLCCFSIVRTPFSIRFAYVTPAFPHDPRARLLFVRHDRWASFSLAIYNLLAWIPVPSRTSLFKRTPLARDEDR